MTNKIEKAAVALAASAIVVPVLVFMVLISTLAGALVGWIVGWFFSDTILHIVGQLGIKGIAMWQLGAFLGFTGSFFKTVVEK